MQADTWPGIKTNVIHDATVGLTSQAHPKKITQYRVRVTQDKKAKQTKNIQITKLQCIIGQKISSTEWNTVIKSVILQSWGRINSAISVHVSLQLQKDDRLQIRRNAWREEPKNVCVMIKRLAMPRLK